MQELTRIWLVPSTSHRARVLELLAGKAQANLDVCAWNLVTLEVELAAVAHTYAGEQVVLWTEPQICLCAAGLALQLSADALDQEAAQKVVCLDYPSGKNKVAQPSLVGVGLDWVPPWNGGKVSKYPGGPGSAAK